MSKKIFALLLCMVLSLTSVTPAIAATNKTTKLSKTQITLSVNQSYNLKLSNNKKGIRWSSNKKSIAIVNSKGKVTTKKKGTAIITAAVGKAKYRCKVIVKQPILSKTKVTLNSNRSYNLKLLYNKNKIKWYSNNKSVATVNSKGKVIARNKGTAIITAAVGKERYRCKIAVKQPHTHTWVNITKTVNHPAITHQEDVYKDQQVLVTAAWDEQVATGSSKVCVQCGYSTTDNDAMLDHMLEFGHTCDVVIQYSTVHHDAVYETKRVKTGTKTVVDKEAWTETVVTGHKCSSCGKTET